MWKLRFFVNCDTWHFRNELGKMGYENMIFFHNEKEAYDWLSRRSDVDKLELSFVSHDVPDKDMVYINK